MITQTLRLCLCWLLFFVAEIHGWSNLPKPQKLRPQLLQPTTTTTTSNNNSNNNNNNKFVRDFAAAALIALFAAADPPNTTPWLPPPAFAASSSREVLEEQLQQSLKPATAFQPQIMLPTSGSVPLDKKQPIVEGLISLSNPTSELRPMATDTIVITFRTFSQPDLVLGGARIPVSKAARFPLAFRMFPKNILEDKKEAWNSMEASKGDLLVKVMVCPEDIPKCTEGESRMQSQGVAKLIRNLPGQQKDQVIRAPAALRLN